MFYTMACEEAATALRAGKRGVVHRTVPGDCFTPVLSYEALRQKGQVSFLLESCPNATERTRYSFLGFDPLVEFEYRKGDSKDPLQAVRQLFQEYQVEVPDTLPPSIGGMMGYFSYDAVRLTESIPDRHPPADYPEIFFGLFRVVLAFDHYNHTVTVTHIVEPDAARTPEPVCEEATQQVDRIIGQLSQIRRNVKAALVESAQGLPGPDITDSDFEAMVLKAKEYIKEGEIFQVVLSRRFQCPYTEDPFAIYRALRVLSPSPYMFYLERPDVAFAGASPERLVQVEGRRLETIPLAGTRRRGQGISDEVLEHDLLSDPKEMAEHMMLVDLARNDLGKVAKIGSVQVKDLATIQHQSHVMHIKSTVVAELAENKDPMDALLSVMPAGTLSGAPKIRAMEIIDELETSRRGLYGGAVGYLDNRGNFDCCISIRMAEVRDGIVTVRAGAGIVADSVPSNEALETRHKAEGVLQAIRLAKEIFSCC